jgi:hypothetical protein
MLSRNRELWLALLAILLITLLYLGVVAWQGTIPAARSFFGHSLGVFGFLLMMMTETLYSLRKRSRFARWGRMAAWLQFHIFTGIVGPFLVFLHSAWEFNGLAGIVVLLTVIIVVSGFFGRYIYTAVPRTADGTEMQARQLGEQIRTIEDELAGWMVSQPPAVQVFAQKLVSQSTSGSAGPTAVLGRALADLEYRTWLRQTNKQIDPAVREQSSRLSQLVEKRRVLRRQMDSLAAARRLLATWHAVHIPIGMALFTAAIVHIAAAIYYATLLH